ncbi:YopX family protein [Streptococcus mitis]|uniref:YopX family protein n=1 Tax=Streptococcus mitis TaxID=28037 RepID=UPI0021B84BA8|nr:YopX family protein [Streptococcus mitis]
MKPKFRAWDKHGQKMFANDELIIWNGNVYANDSKKLTCNNLKGWSIDDEYLMQSTGLKDKNGKEIFEGDIVKMSKDVYSEPTYYEVVRHRGGAYRLESKQHGCELWLRHTDCEVVGNIYENPELLEDKE